jgi:transcription antitermination factor NusG
MNERTRLRGRLEAYRSRSVRPSPIGRGTKRLLTRGTRSVILNHESDSTARRATFRMIPQSQLGQAGPDPVFPWYALRVRSNYENVAAVHLRDRGFEEFYPTYRTERQWSDRKKQIDLPLFPGYVFCRLNPDDRLPVLTVPGTVGLVGFGKGPTAIPEDEIDSVRRMIGSGLLVAPWPFLSVGQSVLIERGPLAGVEGILQEIKKTFRLVVSIGLLQRSVSAEIDRTWIRPLRPPSQARPLPELPRVAPASLY